MTKEDKIFVTFDGVNREATPEEAARIRSRWAEEEAEIAAIEAKAQADAAAKSALLTRLGITADEAKLLLA
jgi:hypothetical protein